MVYWLNAMSPIMTLIAAVMQIAAEVANPLRMLSAYFITSAMIRPSIEMHATAK